MNPGRSPIGSSHAVLEHYPTFDWKNGAEDIRISRSIIGYHRTISLLFQTSNFRWDVGLFGSRALRWSSRSNDVGIAMSVGIPSKCFFEYTTPFLGFRSCTVCEEWITSFVQHQFSETSERL